MKIENIKNMGFYPRHELIKYPLKIQVDPFQLVSSKQ